MKKIGILVVALLLMICIPTQSQAKAKNVFVNPNWNENKIESFLEKHKADNVFMIIKGKRINRNGDGKDTSNLYIKYRKGKIGKKYTSIFQYKKGTIYWDDWCERYDFSGYLSRQKALEKFRKEKGK